jgi:hypothetical protein
MRERLFALVSPSFSGSSAAARRDRAFSLRTGRAGEKRRGRARFRRKARARAALPRRSGAELALLRAGLRT